MWYFSWVLGTGLALVFGVLNAMWYEMREEQDTVRRKGAS
jgi:cytochrome bd-I ubiquinol oxidase subunit X